MKIVIAGATGLVGEELLNQLIQAKLKQEIDIDQIITLTRQPLLKENLNFYQNHIIDWETWTPQNFEAEVFICTLGTTIKEAGSPENFKKVDYHYVDLFAQSALLSKTQKFIFVSSQGANANSLLFYPKVKGEIENQLISLNFNSLALIRPSLLIGKRKKIRPLEQMAQVILPHLNLILRGPLLKFRPIHAHTVAHSIKSLVTQNWLGTLILESDEIK